MVIPSTRSRIGVAVLVIGNLAAAPLLRLGYVRVRWMLLVVVGVLGFLAFRVWRASSRRERMLLAASLGLSLLVVLTLAAPSPWDMGQAAIPVLAGWTVPLAILGWDSEALPRPRTDLGHLGRLLAVWIVFAAALWIAVRPPGHHPITIDEVLYLMQSQHMSNARFMRPLQSDLAPFFLINQSYSVPGFINGQYPPGWPLVLSLTQSLRTGWFLLFGVYVLAVGATYAFGRAVAGARTGLLAAVLVSICAPVLDLSTTFYSHVLEAALALIAGTLMVGSVNAPRERRTVAWIFAGLILGFATLVRPLTGLALAAALWLWVLLRERPTPRAATAATLAACAGAIAPLVFLLYYNAATTGAPLRFGYDMAQHGLQAVGFGRRGFLEYNAVGVAFEHAFAFGPMLAVRFLRQNLSIAVAESFSPIVLVIPIAFVAWRAGVRWRWLPVSAFAVLPLAYAFYFYHGGNGTDRFYFELVPFAAVGTAFLIDRLAQSHRTAGILLGALFVATLLVDSVLDSIVRRREYAPLVASHAVVEQLRTKHPRLLVFVRSHLPQAPVDATGEFIQWGDPVMGSLYGYNVYDFPSDVVVVRDLGERDTVAAARFPGRYNVLLSFSRGSNGGFPWVIEASEFDPATSPRAR